MESWIIVDKHSGGSTSGPTTQNINTTASAHTGREMRSGTLVVTTKGTNGSTKRTQTLVYEQQASDIVLAGSTITVSSIRNTGGTVKFSVISNAATLTVTNGTGLTLSSANIGGTACTISNGTITIPSAFGTSSQYILNLVFTATANQTTSAVTRTAKVSVNKNNGSSVSVTLTAKLVAGVKTYANPKINTFSYATFAAAGATKTPSLSYSQTWGWNGATSGGGTITSGATTVYSMTSAVGFTFNNANTGSVTAANRLKDTGDARTTTMSLTITLNGKSATKTATITQAANSLNWANPTVTAYSYANTSASGNSSNLSPTVTYTQTGTYSSGSKDVVTSGGSLVFASSQTVAGFTLVSTSTGAVKWASRNTDIGNARSAADKLTVKVTLNGKTSSAFTCTSCSQSGNYVTSITVSGSKFSYSNIGAGATSAKASTTNGTVTYHFSSGSSTTTVPSETYGSLSRNVSYSIENTTTNGFKSINGSTGTLSATSRGTTIGNARTSAKVTRVESLTWTPTNDYNSLGEKTTSVTNTATCTQAGNYVTSVTITPTMSYGTAAAGGQTLTPSLGASYKFVFSSGSNSTTAPNTTYGTLSVSNSFSWVADGTFKNLNTSTGAMTVESLGTLVSSQLTSPVVTRTATATWTPTDDYDTEGTKTHTNTCTATATQSANAKTTITYGTPSISTFSYATFSAAGATKTPSLSYSQTREQNYTSGATESLSNVTSGATTSYTLSNANGFTLNNASTGSITAADRAKNTGAARTGTVKVTVTLNGKSATKKITCTQEANTLTWAAPTVTAYSYATASAAGNAANVTPTVTYKQIGTYTSTATDEVTSGGTLAFTLASSVTGFTLASTSTGAMKWSSRGTDIGNSRSAHGKLSVKVTLNGKTSAAFTCTSCVQNGNYVTAISGAGDSLSYNNIGAGATSASATSSNTTVTYTFSSGSTSTMTPGSTYGSFSRSVSYSIANTTTNGFKAINASNGTLTSTSRGTTIGNARTSAKVTRTEVITWTPTSSYNSAGTKTGTYTKTATCTQAGNYVTSIVVTPTVSYGTAGAGGGTLSPSVSHSMSYTFSSGSNSSSSPSSTYGILSVSDTFSFTASGTFSDLNADSGLLTVDSLGTTVSNALTSPVITRTVTATWTPTSGYDSAGTKTSVQSAEATATQSANAKTSITYGTPTISTFSYATFAASGATKTPSLSYSQTRVQNYTSGATESLSNVTSGATTAYAVSTAGDGFTLKSTSTGSVEAAGRGTTAGDARTCKIKVTVTLNGKSATKTATCTQSANAITSIDAVVANSSYGHMYYSTNSVGAGGATLTPTLNGSCNIYYTSGSYRAYDSNDGVTFSRTWLVNNTDGFSINTSGSLTVSNRTTNIGQERSSTVTSVLTVKMGSFTDTLSTSFAVKQSANLVTAVTANSNTFSYSNIGAGATSAAASTSHAPKYTFSSGATSTTTPASTYGSLSTSVGYTIANKTTNGFTNINATTGALTATSRGTTEGAARTSATCTKTLKYTWTPTSGYGSAVNSGNLTKTATCTQNENKITAVVIAGTASSGSVANMPASKSTVTWTPTVTYSSGSTSSDTTKFTPTYTVSGTGATQNGNVTTWASRGTTTGAARSATVTCSVKSTYTTTAVTKTATTTQRANAANASYSAVTISGFSYGSKNAAAGSVSPTVTYTQTPYYTSGAEGTKITSGATLSFATSGTWSGASLNTSTGAVTWKANTDSVSRSVTTQVTVTLNGKSATKTTTSTQSADAISSTSRVISLSANNTSVGAGASTVAITASGTTTYTWVSGKANTTDSFTPTLSISGTGFTLSGTTVTVASRGTNWSTDTRSGIVTASYSGATSKTVTITQAKNVITNLSLSGVVGSISSPGTYGAGKETKTVASSTNASARPTLTFSSGSSYIDTSGTYGTISDETYSWSVSNSYFTLTSANTPSLEVSSVTRGTTYSASTRTSVITRTFQYSYTFKSDYDTEGLTDGPQTASNSATVTLTQAANTRVVSDIRLGTSTSNTSIITSISQIPWEGASSVTFYKFYRYLFASGSYGAYTTTSWTFSVPTLDGLTVTQSGNTLRLTPTDNLTMEERSWDLDIDYGTASYTYSITQEAGQNVFFTSDNEPFKTSENQYLVAPTTILPTSISLNTTSINLKTGNSYQLAAIISPSNAIDKTITWTSTATSVATVSSAGYVTAKSAGSTTIIARTSNGLQATCRVTVTARPSISVNLAVKGSWRAATTASSPSSSYTLYESNRSYHTNRGLDIMRITVSNAAGKTLKIYIRSSAETTWDYTVASKLDTALAATNSSTYYPEGSGKSMTSLMQAWTYNNQQTGTALSNYTLVQYTIPDNSSHFIDIAYKKDGSGDYNSDRGYVLIPKSL